MVDMENTDFQEFCYTETLSSGRSGFFRKFADLVRATVGLKWIEEEFSQLDNNEDRLRALYTADECSYLIKSTLSRTGTVTRNKNAFQSKIKRIDAVRFYQEKNFDAALSHINIAVINAPPMGQCINIDKGCSLLLALLCRFEILMNFGEYLLAFNDLEMAKEISTEYPQYRKHIDFRTVMVLGLIGKFGKTAKTDKRILRSYPQLLTTRDLPSLSGGCNPKLPGVSIKVGLQDTETDEGIEAYAKCDIGIGECIVVEDPLVCTVFQKCILTHCQECTNRVVAAVSCPKCSNVIFCSRKCRDIALSTYHRYECDIMMFLLGSGMSDLTLLAYRAITQNGLDTCLKIYRTLNKDKINDETENETNLSKSARRRRRKKKLKEATVQTSETNEETNETSETDDMCNNLSSISLDEETPADTALYGLVTHNSRRTPLDFFERTLMAAFLLKCLQRTNFFKTTSKDNEVPNKEEIMVGSLILNNLQSFQFNAHELHEIHFFKSIPNGGSILHYVALAIYPAVARFNHDCFPTLSRHYNGKKIIMHTLKPFKQFDPLPENYGTNCHVHTRSERQAMLYSRYWFKCTCKACVEDWPIDPKTLMAKIKCPTFGCKKLFVYGLCKDSNKLEFCNFCRKKVDVKNSIDTLDECETKYGSLREAMDTKNYPLAVEHLSNIIATFYKVAVPPHEEIYSTQSYLRNIFCYYGNTYSLQVKHTLSDDDKSKE